MSNSQNQTENERFILENFFSVMGIEADSIDRGPTVNGNDKPDFVVCITGKKIGIEETRYFMKQRPDWQQPRQAIESAWDNLKTVIEERRRRYSELKEVHGAISFREFVLPPSREYGPFASELIEFSMDMLGGFGFDPKRYRTFDEKYLLLNEYVEYLKLQQVECYGMSWDWLHNAEFVGLQERELHGIIQTKIERHVPSPVDENWLLVTSAPETSQQMGYLFVGGLNKYKSVCDLLNDCPFDKVYIYDYTRSKVFLWTLDGGWVAATTNEATSPRLEPTGDGDGPSTAHNKSDSVLTASSARDTIRP